MKKSRSAHFLDSKATFFIVFLISALLLSLALFGLRIGDFQIKGSKDMRFGIDIRGGVEATYAPKDLGRAPTSEELDKVKTILESRMDAANISDREITVDRINGDVIVRFPWQSQEKDFNPENAINELGQTAQLSFKDPSGNTVLQGSDVKKSFAQMGNDGKYQVALQLTDEGSSKFETATGNLVGKAISIYMDQTLISSPTVDQKISGGNAVITHISTLQEATNLANKINSGALPFSMVVNN
ncbi:MAG: protein translocase subunit SecD, partial [Bacillota bacterium]|nr:protein translocase subunit SecD [Bacillota bacterium]